MQWDDSPNGGFTTATKAWFVVACYPVAIGILVRRDSRSSNLFAHQWEQHHGKQNFVNGNYFYKAIMTMGCSFNLRHQVGELEDARLTVFPEHLDGAEIFFNHFALSFIGNPDYSVAHLQSFGFLRLHLMENAPVTYPREGARLGLGQNDGEKHVLG
jgi:hypothetical protein